MILQSRCPVPEPKQVTRQWGTSWTVLYLQVSDKLTYWLFFNNFFFHLLTYLLTHLPSCILLTRKNGFTLVLLKFEIYPLICRKGTNHVSPFRKIEILYFYPLGLLTLRSQDNLPDDKLKKGSISVKTDPVTTITGGPLLGVSLWCTETIDMEYRSRIKTQRRSTGPGQNGTYRMVRVATILKVYRPQPYRNCLLPGCRLMTISVTTFVFTGLLR